MRIYCCYIPDVYLYIIKLDVDECFMAAIEAIDLCESNQNSQCVNTEGSFDCSCVPGYIDVNGTCERELKYTCCGASKVSMHIQF